MSIIVPTFNRKALLARAIDSAFAQTHNAIEVIVIDDGSTDGTTAMLQTRYGSESRLRVLRQENQGVAAARNRGLKAARGTFIAFLDSDDFWRPWKLSVQLVCIVRRPEAGMVWTDMEAIGPGGQVVHERYLRKMYSAYRHLPAATLFESTERLGSILAVCPAGLEDASVLWGRIGTAMVIGNLVHTSTVLMRRSLLERVGEFDLSLSPAGEDHDFHLRTCRAGPVGLIDVVSTSYQTGMSDRLTLHREAMVRNYFVTMERALARMASAERPPARMLRRARARGHAWMADVRLDKGDKPGARRALFRSLLHDPLQAGLAARLLAASLPDVVSDSLRRLIRVRRKLRWPRAY